jgi:hypothetical protein
MLASVADTSTRYVDHVNHRVYECDLATGKTYAQAQASCAALTYTGVTGKGYLVAWNTWGRPMPLVLLLLSALAAAPAACARGAHLV